MLSSKQICINKELKNKDWRERKEKVYEKRNKEREESSKNENIKEKKTRGGVKKRYIDWNIILDKKRDSKRIQRDKPENGNIMLY